MDLSGTGFSATEKTFRAELYAKLYDRLASLYRENYQSVYSADAIGTPVTVKGSDLNPETEVSPSPTPESSAVSLSQTNKENVKPAETKEISTKKISTKKTISLLKLTSFKKGSKKIVGKTLKKATIIVKIGKKTYKVKANKKGKFTIELKKKLKKKQKIVVTAKKSGYKTKKKIFKVKK